MTRDDRPGFQPLDSQGRRLAVGDTVIVVFRIEALDPDGPDHYCRLRARVWDGMTYAPELACNATITTLVHDSNEPGFKVPKSDPIT